MSYFYFNCSSVRKPKEQDTAMRIAGLHQRPETRHICSGFSWRVSSEFRTGSRKWKKHL